MLHTQFEGLTIGRVQEGIKRTPLILRRNSHSENFENLQLTLPNDGHITITSVAKISRTEGVISTEREKGQRFIVIQSNIVGRDLVGFVNEACQRVAEKVKLPIDYHVEFGGQFKNQQRAANRLSLVIPNFIRAYFLTVIFNISLRQAGIFNLI